MVVERKPAGCELIDVLDRVLDKGIVIDASMRIGLVGLDLVSLDMKVVVASIETYLRHCDALALAGTCVLPPSSTDKSVQITKARKVTQILASPTLTLTVRGKPAQHKMRP